jgi:CheY-like chemotaxis protein
MANDVLVVTEKGNAELRGGGTSLPPEQLQALILVDGRSSVAQIVASAQGAKAALPSEAIARLLEQRYVSITKAAEADSIDPDETLNPNAAAAVAGSVSGFTPLTAHGFHAAVAVRAAAKRKLVPGTKVRVLAIDEDANIAKFLRAYFEPERFDLKVAGDKTQITEALRQPPLPDVVLADASLPGIDAIVATMRRHEVIGKIPVVMFAGDDTREAVIQALQRGVNAYMTKPLDMDLLLACTRSVLGLPQERGPSMGFGGVGSPATAS